MEEAFSVDGTPIEYVLVTVFVFDVIYRYVIGAVICPLCSKTEKTRSKKSIF